jgi:beta-glucosidase
MAGVETAFLFIHSRIASGARPVLELRGFTRIELAAGACGTVRFELPARELGSIDGEGVLRLEAGEFEIFVGPKAEREVLLGGIVRLSVI